MPRRLKELPAFARGCRDFVIHHDWRRGFGGPFNGQQFRQAMFLELVRSIPFSAIIETGTFRGTTTEYMHHEAQLPVYSVEHSGRAFAFSYLRFLSTRGVRVYWADSRQVLERLGTLDSLRGTSPFCYLDAHWDEDLPLADELSFIFATWPRAVVMIDDFKVPDDPGYAFDTYDSSGPLDLEYLGTNLVRPVTPFFPARPSGEETGYKRGSVVLAHDPGLISALSQCSSLRAAQGIDPAQAQAAVERRIRSLEVRGADR